MEYVKVIVPEYYWIRVHVIIFPMAKYVYGTHSPCHIVEGREVRSVLQDNACGTGSSRAETSPTTDDIVVLAMHQIGVYRRQ